MGHYASLRDYIEMLESREKLFRIQREVCRETELHPLVRWQFRGLPEGERRAFLFEKVASVTGRKYDMSVLFKLKMRKRLRQASWVSWRHI